SAKTAIAVPRLSRFRAAANYSSMPFGEGDTVWLRASPGRELGPGSDHGPVGHDAARPVERQGGHHPTCPPVGGHKLPIGGVALDHHDLVVGSRVADVLDLGVV